MTEPVALILAALSAAIVSGLVAIASSALSLRAARQQIESANRERDEDRRHDFVLTIVERRHQALEGIWELLFVLERAGRLDDRETERFVRQLIWLPRELQGSCLALLQGKSVPGGFSKTRQELVDLANTVPSAARRTESHD